MDKITSCFYSGNYTKTLELTQEIKAKTSSLSDIPDLLFGLEIGALVFTGKLREAKINFQKYLDYFHSIPTIKKDSSRLTLFLIRSHFFLAIGHIRKSSYDEAIQLLARNLLLLRKLKKSKNKTIGEEIFFVYQGVAFFRFFKGEYQRAIEFAEISYSGAFSQQFKYGQALSLDLLGHSLCQTGEIRRGLSELEKAIQVVLELGNGGLEISFRISLVKYQAQYGINLKDNISILKQAIKSLSPQDTYSSVELYLELSRQLILRGEGSKAREYLDLASDNVYKHQNKRQLATFNIRYSHLLLLSGEPQAALALLHSMLSSLDPNVDSIFLIQTRGLIDKIYEFLPHQTAKNEYVTSSNEISNLINLRILHRKNPKTKRQIKDIRILRGEDPLGDIIDDVYQKKIDMFEEVSQLGLLGLYMKMFDFPFGKSFIYLGPKKNELILVSKADILHIKEGVNQVIKKVLFYLQGASFKTKEYLITMVWNYKYNPIIHDPLLYSTMAKVRKCLKNFSSWIEWTPDGYMLAAGVLILTEQKQAPSETMIKTIASDSMKEQALPNSPNHVLTDIHAITIPLNIRQLKLLKKMKKNEFISVKEYVKFYKVSPMTAFRDLSMLHKMGKLVKVGTARSTVYGKI